jgi:hypothetical protein
MSNFFYYRALYRAEDKAFKDNERANKPFKTIAQAQRYINALCEHKALRREFPQMRYAPRVEARAAHAKTSVGGGSIKLAPGHLKRWIAVHELAHCIAPTNEGHGRTYARIYLRLVRDPFGGLQMKAKEYAKRLETITDKEEFLNILSHIAIDFVREYQQITKDRNYKLDGSYIAVLNQQREKWHALARFADKYAEKFSVTIKEDGFEQALFITLPKVSSIWQKHRPSLVRIVS